MFKGKDAVLGGPGEEQGGGEGAQSLSGVERVAGVELQQQPGQVPAHAGLAADGLEPPGDDGGIGPVLEQVPQGHGQPPQGRGAHDLAGEAHAPRGPGREVQEPEDLGRGEVVVGVAGGEHEAPHPFGVVRGHQLTQRAARVVADQGDLVETEPVAELDDEAGQSGRGEVGVGVHGGGVGAEGPVGCQTTGDGGQASEDGTPQRRGRKHPVHEHHGVAGACVPVADDAGRGGGLLPRRGRTGGGRRRHGGIAVMGASPSWGHRRHGGIAVMGTSRRYPPHALVRAR